MPKNTPQTQPKSAAGKTRRFTKKTASLNVSPKKSGAIFAPSTTSEDDKLEKVLQNCDLQEGVPPLKKCRSAVKRKKNSPSKAGI